MGKRYCLLFEISSLPFFVVIVAGAVTVWFNFLLLPVTWTAAWVISGIIIVVGVYLFVLSKREFDLQKQRMDAQPTVLITSGVYSSIRHPHYLAGMLLSFAVALGLRSVIGLLIALVQIAATYALVLEEEKLLIEKFGDRYREYKARVPMFVPRLRRIG